MWIKDESFKRTEAKELPFEYWELLDYFTKQAELEVNPEVKVCRDTYETAATAAAGDTAKLVDAATSYQACIQPHASIFSAEVKAGEPEPVFASSRGSIVIDSGAAEIETSADGKVLNGQDDYKGNILLADRMLKEVMSVSVFSPSTTSTSYEVTIERAIYACAIDKTGDAASIADLEADGCEVYWSDKNVFAAQRAFSMVPYRDVEIPGVDPNIFNFIVDDIDGDDLEDVLMLTHRGEIHAFMKPIEQVEYDYGYSGGCSTSPTSPPPNFGIGRALEEAGEEYGYLFRIAIPNAAKGAVRATGGYFSEVGDDYNFLMSEIGRWFD